MYKRQEYYTQGRGELSERNVEPLRLQRLKQHWYIVAWCRKADDLRSFRLDRIKSLVRALAEREKLVGILDRTLATRGVHVLLPGDDESSLGVEQLSVVGTRYAVEGAARGQGAVGGAVGVIGPTRMDYASIVPLVDETARGLGAWLSSQRGHDESD